MSKLEEPTEEINALTVGSMMPANMLSILHDRYKDLELPQNEITPYDLAYIESTMGYLANEHSYLNYMFLIASINTRNAKAVGNKELYEVNVSRKNILKAYMDELDNMNKSLSRMITIYSLSKAESQAEDRVTNAQRYDADIKE